MHMGIRSDLTLRSLEAPCIQGGRELDGIQSSIGRTEVEVKGNQIIAP